MVSLESQESPKSAGFGSRNLIYFLRRLRGFIVCNKMLKMIYQSVVASDIFYAAVCWVRNVRARDKLVRNSGSVIG